MQTSSIPFRHSLRSVCSLRPRGRRHHAQRTHLAHTSDTRAREGRQRYTPVNRKQCRAAPRRTGIWAMTTTSRTSFGTRLRQYRLAAGLTQEALAERAGVECARGAGSGAGVRLAPRAEKRPPPRRCPPVGRPGSHRPDCGGASGARRPSHHPGDPPAPARAAGSPHAAGRPGAGRVPLSSHALQASYRCSSSFGTRPDPLHHKHGRTVGASQWSRPGYASGLPSGFLLG